MLLQISNLSKSYGDKILFTEAEVTINENEKIGVIGRNGAGKSTLFKILMNLETQDTGEIIKSNDLRIGYIPQVDPFEPSETIIGFLTRYTKRENWECAIMAAKFQLKGPMLDQPISNLSGGYQMRVKLTSTLLFEPNLLLLDEPTNYLDLSTLLLLENFLKTFKGSFLCITHDREFIKKTAEMTMEVEHGKIVLHPESLEDYLEFKAENVALAENLNKNIERKQKQLQTFVTRFGATASMAKSAQSKAKVIAKLDDKKITINNALATVRMWIPPVINRGGHILEIKKLEVGYPNKSIAQNITIDIEKGKKIAVLGDNGQGKSTLLKTLYGKIEKLSGEFKWIGTPKIGYYAQHVNQDLDLEMTIFEYLKGKKADDLDDASILRMMSNFLFTKNDSLKPIGVLSGGEKARLCLAGLFLSKSDVLMLDEPTNHLDFETVEAMGSAINDFNGTVIIVSHDRTFISLVANEIWEVKNGNAKVILGTFEDYVWIKENEAKDIVNAKPSEDVSESANNPSKPTKALDKEQRVKLYNLKKDLEKASRKIKNIQSKIDETPNDNSLKTQLGDAESAWLAISEEINNLES